MKALLSAALISLSAVSSWSQGVVQFQNGQITFVTVADRLVYFDFAHTIPLTGTNYAAGLWYVPGADNGSQLLSPTGGAQAGALAFFRAQTTSVPGVWANPPSAGNTRMLDGVAVGTFATLQVRVWDITKYATFAQAFAGGEYAWSAPFNFRAPDFVHGDPANAAYMENLRAFPLIPEPSAFTLGLLAGGSLLLWRWRSRRRAHLN